MRVSTFSIIITAFLLILSTLTAHAYAQTGAQLRERLERVRHNAHPQIPEGTLTSIAFLIDLADRIEDRFGPQSQAWRRRTARYLDQVEHGVDPYLQEKNKITNRGYRSAASTILQGYAIYLPPNYDPNRAYPLYVAMHGGSSNGNLFLGVVLGNNMDWLTYNQHLWDEYTPRWSPDWIVVAPTGYGQMLWRWMAEQDVLDVIADVQQNYHVDPNHIVLGGLSNGGVGAYTIGMRHAWKFSTVMAMAGAPSWLQYAPCGGCAGLDLENVRRYSGMHLIENSFDTVWKTYHGRTDTGPMRPAFINQLEERIRETSAPINVTWYNTGHDILYIAHERGRIYERLNPIVRNPQPTEVRVVTGDYRAARQHWVTVTRLADYPALGRVRATVSGNTVQIETSKVSAFSIDLRDVPIRSEQIVITINRQETYSGIRTNFGHLINFIDRNGRFEVGFPEDEGLVKKPRLAGPINDAYYDRMIHVYGTKRADQTESLKRAAQRGARGWVLWSWDISQQVVADTDLTDDMMQNAHIVLYGTKGSNAVLDRIQDRLPIKVNDDSIQVGAERFVGRDVGVRFIYPNPLAPDHYVLVQGGVTPDAVASGNDIPEFLPDWFVYNHATTRSGRNRHAGSRSPARASGWFDDHWQLRTRTAERTPSALPTENVTSLDNMLPLETMEGGDPQGRHRPIPSRLPVPASPAAPTRPTTFLAPENSAEGRAAREIARRVTTFHNYRATIRGAVWTQDPASVFRIRPASDCLAQLTRDGVPHRVAQNQSWLIPTPVWITGPIHDVHFQMAARGRPFVVACELAAKLARTAEVVKRHGITAVGVVSAYRDNPYTSFHTMGFALDIASFRKANGQIMRVVSDFEMTPNQLTCSASAPRRQNAQLLLAIACDLASSHLWNSVLTPNYNEGHRDHFHVDARPDDPRLFVR